VLSLLLVEHAGALAPTTPQFIDEVTGPGSTSQTDVNYMVGGTDLGIVWQHDATQYLIAFGDTFADAAMTTDWRCNTLARSTDTNLSNGLTFSTMIQDWPGHAMQIIDCAKINFVEKTVIPTAGVTVGSRAYIHYMSVNNWGSVGGTWLTNESGIAYSDNAGGTWTKPAAPRWANSGGGANFQQAAFVKSGGYVYMFGTPNGRLGNAYLARVPEASVLTKSAYRYWTGSAWSTSEAAALSVVPGPVGELSVMYNAHFGVWLMMYLNEAREAIVLRESPSLTGPWSSERIVVTASTYPGLYGGFMDPRSTGPDIYFHMSVWSPVYNVYLMRTTLGTIAPPDTGSGGCQSSSPYTNCADCEGSCTGPSLSTSWSKAHFRVRYKCCFNPNWGQWQEVGINTSYTAPFAVFAYEVQVLALTADGSFVQWYPWKQGNLNGSTQTVSWQSARYAAQLTHADWFMNACNDGTGAQLPGCVDYRSYSTSSSATFSGLSPVETYDLFVDIKDNQNSGVSRLFHTDSDLETGSCNCAPVPTPTFTPTPTPTVAPVIFSDCSAPAILRPLSDAGLNNWDNRFPASGGHWDKVDEPGSDGDATYISSTVDGDWDQFGHATLNLPAGATISGVTVFANGRYVTASSNNIVAPALRVGSGFYWADRAITGSYSTVSGSWTTNPATGAAWTLAEVNSALLAVRKSYQGADVRVTQVWAQVDCAPPAPTSCANPIILRPTANGVLNNWDVQAPSSGAHWEKVREVSSDEDATYLSSTVDARWDDFAHTPLNISAGATIQSVTVYARGRWTTSSANNMIAPALRSGGSVVWADRTITNAYGNVSGAWSTNPATGQAWTQAGVNSAYIGVRKSYQGANVRVTQVWAEVHCTDP
jgi:hypothetical protein